jgi:hypothetical protein
MAQIRIDIASEFKDKGFKRADRSASALDAKFARLGRTIATVFSVQQVTRFAKSAVQGFKEDELAAVRFEQALKGVNLGFAAPEINTYLDNLEKQTGILKDELVPAYQSLAQTTRSVLKSQDILNTAIDTAAGSGYDLNTVVRDLTRSYVGNNAGLAKYNLGLSKTELRTTSFAKVQELLNKQFTGQRAAYLETYAGKVDMLRVSYDLMSDTIGESLVDAFGMLAGENGIGGATTAMERFGQSAADVIRGVGVAVSEVSSRIPFFDKIFDTSNIPVIGAYIDMFKALGEPKRPLFFPTAGQGQPAVDKRLAAIEEAAIKRQKELEALRLKSLRAQEKANRLKRISIMLMEKEKKFDLTRIQLQAASQGKLTSEEANRVKELQLIEDLKQAIAEQDLDKAEKLLEELNKVREETEILAETLLNLKAGNPFEDWDDYFKNVEEHLAKLQAQLMGLLAGMKLDLASKNQAVLEAKTDRSTAVAAIVEASGVSAELAMADALKAIEDANKAIADAKTPEELEAAQTFLEAALESKEAAETLAESVAAVTLASALTDLDLANEYLSQSIDAATGLGLIPEVNVTVNIEGNVTTQEDLVNSITEGLYQAQKSGKGLLFSAVAI